MRFALCRVQRIRERTLLALSAHGIRPQRRRYFQERASHAFGHLLAALLIDLVLILHTDFARLAHTIYRRGRRPRLHRPRLARADQRANQLTNLRRKRRTRGRQPAPLFHRRSLCSRKVP